MLLGLLAPLFLVGCAVTSPSTEPAKGPERPVEGKSDPSGEEEVGLTYHIRDIEVRAFIDTLARDSGASIAVPPGLKGTLTMSINNVPWRDVLFAVARTFNHRVVWEGASQARIVAVD
jgi:hypothetical protein